MRLSSFLLTLSACLAVQALAHAQVPTSIFEITDKGKTAYCGYVKSWVPAVKLKDGSFKTISAELRTIATKLRTATGDKKKSLEKRQTNLKGIQSRTKSTCAKGPTGTPPTQPTATPTPGSPPVGCFIPGGDIVAGCFGIPTNLTANIIRGEVYFTNNCKGCHASRPARNFTYVKAKFSEVPQMRPFLPVDAVLADIVGYLNRFNFENG